MDDSLHALRIAARSLIRARGFTITALLTLALGLGLTTAVFTVANALLLRRLPVREQERLVLMWGEPANRSFENFPLTFDGAREFARRTRTLDGVAFIGYEGAWAIPVRDGSGDEMTSVRRAVVSGNLFDVLGARPLLGRALRPSDDEVGAAPVAVVSERLWRTRFGGDSRAIGRHIVEYQSGISYSVVGVMPQGLDVPRDADLWVAIVPARTKPGTDSTVADVDLVARLRPTHTPEAAREELSAFFARPDAAPVERDLHGIVHSLPRRLLGDARPAVLAFAVAAALLLLITCINVANLLLVRGLGRAREMAVRTALGAERRQVIAQLLTENALLAAMGGALGTLVAWIAVRLFVAAAPPDLPRVNEIALDGTALAGAMTITTAALLLFGIAPALMSSRMAPHEPLRGARSGATRGSRRLTEALVAAQVALAVIVLAAAGLITRSLVALERADLAFEPTHVVFGTLTLTFERFGDARAQLALLDRLLPAIEAMPGVRAASPTVALPFSGSGGWDGRAVADGQTEREALADPMLNMEVVGPKYFTALGVPVVRGRAFTSADREGAPAVIMVSASTAHHFWPNENPIGKRLGMNLGKGPWWTVVGIVPDTRYRELRSVRPSIYFPLHQSFFPYAPLNLVVRAQGQPAALIPALRRLVAEVDPGVALARAAPFETLLAVPLAQPRLNALMLGVFAMAALLLAAVGLFGVMATMVRRRTRELGVRMAVGATTVDVWRLVMERGLAIAGIGLVVGIIAASAANRLLAAMLYEVKPMDVPSLGAAAGAILIAAIGATLAPARTSARIEPAIALRVEE